MNEIKLQTVISNLLIITIILVAGFGILSIDFSSPDFKKSPKEIQEALLKNDYLINIESLNLKDSINDFILIDLRSQFEYERGHFDNAVNMYAPRILEKENLEHLTNVSQVNKTIILYSDTPQNAMGSWYILSSLGFENIKVLNVQTQFKDNQLKVNPFNAEVLKTDIAAYIKEQNEIKMEPVKTVPVIKPLPIVKPIKKEKIEVEEGGC